MSRWHRPLPAAVLVVAVLAAGCGRHGGPRIPPAPDLEALDAAVQAQYRERRAALEEVENRSRATAAERAAAYGALGQWHHAYGFYAAARAAYGAAGSLVPEDPRWPYYLAHVARVTGDREASRRWLQRVLELEPGHLAARVWLAETEWEAGQTAAAVESFDAALMRDPRCVRALAGRARASLAQGRPGAAVEIYRAALRLQPGSAALRYGLGLAYRQLGDLERAAAELAAVSEDNGEHAPPALDDPWMEEVQALEQGYRSAQRRGQRALAAGRFEDAAAYFRQAVEADSDAVEARLNLALALDQAGKPAAAEAAAAEAVAHDPGFARARVVLGTLLLRQQRLAEAERQFQAAADADPDHEAARFNLAQLLRARGRLEEALAHYARVRQLDPRIVMASHGHAVVLLWLGRPAAARQALEEDLRRLPGDPDLSLLLARTLAAAPEEPLRDGSRSLELARAVAAGGTTVTGAETIAMALAELGRFTAAAAWQGAALAAVRGAGRRNAGSHLEQRLDLYRRGRPCREPWSRGEFPDPLPVAPPAGLEAAGR